jgi:hypothetical protein
MFDLTKSWPGWRRPLAGHPAAARGARPAASARLTGCRPGGHDLT